MTADTVGGVFTYAVELARALAPHGVTVLLATMGRRLDGAQRRQARQAGNVTVIESTYKLEWMDDAWADVEAAGEWLLRLEAAHKPDVIHVNGYAHGALGWRAPVVAVGHSCVLSWWRAVKHTEAPPEWDGYRNKAARGLQAADVVVAPTRAMLGELQRYYGPLTETQVIPNGVARGLYTPRPKRDYILSAGRLWDEAKNVQLLATIAPQLPWPVFVAGEGTPAWTSNFFQLGALSRGTLSVWQSQAAIYALPALYEPFGLSVLEAARCGCALVLGDIASLRENWEGAAEFIDPNDARAAQRKIKALVMSADRLHRLQAAAFDRAQSFSAASMAEAYKTVYHSLISRTLACAS
ncbi:MAG: glycosyltransferase family 4 protein [Bryobacterales bacterium]|nr:glycosyltransferase family 4 protein [Bryobacterales bacterium]